MVLKNYEKIRQIQLLRFVGHGHYQVNVRRYNSIYSAVITDMTLIDAYKSEERGWKAAGNHIYKIVVRTGSIMYKEQKLY